MLVQFSPNALAGETANDFRVVVQFAVVLALEGKGDVEAPPALAEGLEAKIEEPARGDKMYLHPTRAGYADNGARTHEIGAKEGHSEGHDPSDFTVGRATASGYTRRMGSPRSGFQEALPQGDGTADEDSGVSAQVIGGYSFSLNTIQ